MCRLAAYLGEPIKLARFLAEPEHSLIKQSWAPREMREAVLNADGFGIGWLADDNRPCLYKNVLPIWSDANLEGLGRSLSSRLWIANVRSATPGQAVNSANTQPFIKDRLVFTHNGYIKPFDHDNKSRLLERMSSRARADITGDSDSQYLFALLGQQLRDKGSIEDAIMALLATLTDFCRDNITALLNMIISDGETLYVCRQALNGLCPSLYYLPGEGHVLVASEPLTPGDDWQACPAHSLTLFRRAGIERRLDL